MTDAYRPPRAPVQWSSVRDLTLGDVVDRTRRQAGYVGIVGVVLIIAVFFPGALPITRQLLPSGGLADQNRGTEQATEVLGATADNPSGESGRSVSDGDGDGSSSSTGARFGTVLGDDHSKPKGGGVTTAPPSAPTACGPDAQLPQPVVGPTLEQVQAAQAALEEGIGRPFPVDLVGTLQSQVCGIGASAATADLLVLGRFVPRDDPALLTTLAPVVAPACDTVTGMAVMEAMAMGRVLPSTSDAVALCSASRSTAAAATPAAPAAEPVDAPVPLPFSRNFGVSQPVF